MKKNTTTSPHTEMIFRPRNYIFMFIGILFLAIGFLLMSGGGSDDPDVFNYEMFSFQRIRLAPLLVIFGFVIQIYAILSRSKTKK